MEASCSDTRLLNPDLNHPKPNVTYVVDDKHVFVTGHRARMVEVHIPGAQPGEARRFAHMQRAAGKLGGEESDGAHLIQNALGDGRERINIVPMLEELNRSGSKKCGRVAGNYFEFRVRSSSSDLQGVKRSLFASR